jgi:hypothetical protein
MNKREIRRNYSNRESVYNCNFCGLTYDKPSIVDHVMKCTLNYKENKTCSTCNKYEIHRFGIDEIEDPSSDHLPIYKKYNSKIVSRGATNYIYCPIKKEYLGDEELELELDCYEPPKDEAVTVDSYSYTKNLIEIGEELAKDDSNFIDSDAKIKYGKFIKDLKEKIKDE